MATAALIREQLSRALEYRDKQDKAQEDQDEDMPDFDAKLEALSAVAGGDLPAHFHAHRADDIATAVRLSREFGLSYVIVHGPRAIWWPICWPGKAFRSSPAPADRSQQAGAGGVRRWRIPPA